MISLQRWKLSKVAIYQQCMVFDRSTLFPEGLSTSFQRECVYLHIYGMVGFFFSFKLRIVVPFCDSLLRLGLAYFHRVLFPLFYSTSV